MVFGFGKKYKCEACGMSFKTEAELMEHNKTMHPVSQPSTASGTNQFKCATCGMTFATQAELMEHSKKAHPM